MSLLKRFFAAVDDLVREKTDREKRKSRNKYQTRTIKKKQKRVKTIKGKLQKHYKKITGKAWIL